MKSIEEERMEKKGRGIHHFPRRAASWWQRDFEPTALGRDAWGKGSGTNSISPLLAHSLCRLLSFLGLPYLRKATPLLNHVFFDPLPSLKTVSKKRACAVVQE